MEFIIGLDIGCTELKVLMFDKEGNIIARSSSELKLIIKNDFIECDFEEYFKILLKNLKEVVAKSRVDPKKIKGISISSQAGTFVLTDKNFVPLDSGISWADNRAATQAKKINDHFGVDFLYNNTGLPELFANSTAPKILWIKENRKDLFNKTAHIFLVEDYMGYRLSAKSTINGSLATSTGMFNIIKYKWQEEILSFLGIREEMLSIPDYCENIKGYISKEISKETGLSTKTIISTGGMDQMFCAVGAGNIRPGIVTENTGSVTAVMVTLKNLMHDPKKLLQCYCHAVKGKYIFMPYNNAAAVCLRWFRDEFCEKEVEISEREGKNIFDLLTEKAAKIPPGSEGITFLPHLQGSTFPEMNLNAKGIFFGFSLGTKKAHFIRAILEGVSYSIRNLIKMLEDMGLPTSEIRSIGGTSKSDAWSQIKADIIGKPLNKMRVEDSGCLGAAIFGGVASGVFESVEEAVDSLVKKDKIYVPDIRYRDIYEEGFRKYNLLYKSVEDLFN